MFESPETRMTSFEEESNQLFEQGMISELSNAGFYYTGWQDVVACHACGIQLTEIAANKRVMATHTRLSPSCPFIKETKGNAYIKDILDVVGQAVPQTIVTFNLRTFDNREEHHKDMFLFASSLPRSQSKDVF
ncbi:Baculoviral IAP repeat-containing protein 1 [Mizuhopecten yessoensis]|uniref:Baculoviral IAP repeat-containing protein 1 n=1 Tax=Mizuhopecten yessoensis TaxID=6573 RepID=A0A210QK11_MIZYE|nr:Baculoviral IAP repeat-containing protein 1 [Mizuhopecten yessoensis]